MYLFIMLGFKKRRTVFDSSGACNLSPKTTQIYTNIMTKVNDQIKNPLDNLDL